MKILGVDPGTTQSGYVLFDGKVIESGVVSNDVMLDKISNTDADLVAIERFESRGMILGEDSLETLVWTGRFIQASSKPITRIKRSAVKRSLFGKAGNKATDSTVRTFLIQNIGEPGTKKFPGPTYGVTSHAWQALAVAYVVAGENK